MNDDAPIWAIAVGCAFTICLQPESTTLLLTAFLLLGVISLIRQWPLGIGIGLGAAVCFTIADGPKWEGALSVLGTVVAETGYQEVEIGGLSAARPDGVWTPASGRIRAKFRENPPQPGQQLLVWGIAGPLKQPWLPGEPDPVRNAARSGVHTWFEVKQFAILHPEPTSLDPFSDSRHRGVFRALVFDDRQSLSPETNDRYRKTGTSHILSISGFHVALVAGAVAKFLQLLFRAFALIRPRGTSDFPAWMIGALVGCLYVAAAGAPVSAQRAAVMAVIGAVAYGFGRRPDPFAALGAAGLAILIVEPASISMPAFQLSFGAILGLIRVTPKILAVVPPDLPRPIQWLLQALATTLGATIGTLPTCAWVFQTLSPTAPVANLFVVPLFSFIVTPIAVIVGFIPHTGALLPIAEITMDLIDRGLTPLAVEPWTPAFGPLLAAIGGILLIWPRRWTWIACGMTLILWGQEPNFQQPTVTFLDVGQGDAAFYEEPNGRRLLVDVGPNGRDVVRWLRRRGIRHIDGIVISHGHPDHMGGLEQVLAGLSVDHIWIPDAPGLETVTDLAQHFHVPIEIGMPGMLHPMPDFSETDLNERSLVVPLGDVLFTGDIERQGEFALQQRSLTPIEVLKIPHHGSRTSSSLGFLNAARPRIAVLSAGRQNAFGHPHLDVVERYRSLGIRLFRTDRDGTIQVRILPETLEISTWRAGASEQFESIPRMGAWPWRSLPAPSSASR